MSETARILAHLLVVGHQRLNRLLVGVPEGRALEETVAAGATPGRPT